MILIKTPGVPEAASCKTSPIKLMALVDVVGSIQAQTAVGEDNPAYCQTPVMIEHKFELDESKKTFDLTDEKRAKKITTEQISFAIFKVKLF